MVGVSVPNVKAHLGQEGLLEVRDVMVSDGFGCVKDRRLKQEEHEHHVLGNRPVVEAVEVVRSRGVCSVPRIVEQDSTVQS